MRRRMLRISRVVAVFAGFWLAGLAAASDGHRQSYLDGRRAFEQGDWQRAARLLLKAVAERPEESPRARLVGAIPEPYLPQAYLGLALYHLRRCDEAVPVLGASLAQRAVEVVRELATSVGAAHGHCSDLNAARSALAAAEQAERRLKVSTGRSDSGSGDPELAGRLRVALEGLVRAREQLATAEADWLTEQARQAKSLAEAARSELGWVADGFEERSRREQSQRAGSRLERALDPTQDLGAITTEPVTEALPPTSPVSPEPPIPELATTGENVPAAPLEGVIPPSLRAAMEAYFAGEYAEAVRRLETPTGPERALLNSRPASHVRLLTALFRAAARYALYLLSGEVDGGLLLAAEADVQAARREDPAFAPHPDFFSPRFLEFFRDHP